MIGVLRALDALLRDPSTPAGPLPFDLLRQVLRRFPRDGGGFFSTSQLLAGFRAFHEEAGIEVSEEAFVGRLRFRPTRTRSGVAPVAVFTKPYPCPGKCVFCPNDVRMPKSYLSDEPGAQRAEDNQFDPYWQTWMRLAALHATGHPIHKVELIILGGTWSFYAPAYQRWFVRRCFDALNDFDGSSEPKSRPAPNPFETLSRHVDGRTLKKSYNQQVSGRLREVYGGQLVSEEEQAGWDDIEQAHERNETAHHRCVGLVVETRPDEIDVDCATNLRRLGVTKVQLGIQSLNDAVLLANKRGHDSDCTREAASLLRRFGFKIQAHWMPNLLGSTPVDDRCDYDELFTDPALRPDELKIYPCSLVESAELMQFHESGQWRPYSREELLGVLSHALRTTPRYCRLSRVVRDIPGTDIVRGSRNGNLRETVEARLQDRGIRRRDIRSREVRGSAVDPQTLSLRRTHYPTASGEELFLEWVTPQDRIVGFLRLFLPREPAPLAELRSSALIREVHVYGLALNLGTRDAEAAQHRGLGRALIEQASHAAAEAGFDRVSVISAIGTRPYYRALDFEDGPLYQHKRTRLQPTKG